jgi:hypothetical protein
MNCHEALHAFNARLDDEPATADGAELDAHLAGCADCRATAEALRLQDVALGRAFQPRRAAAAGLASRVLAEFLAPAAPAMPLTGPSPAFAPPAPLPADAKPNLWRRRWLPLLAASAAGFLLAVLVFRPWRSEPPEAEIVHAPAAGRLALATGPVQIRQAHSQEWLSCPTDAPIPPGAHVKTAEGVRCELTTAHGCVVRLNSGTEVCLRDARLIELATGELWTSAPAEESLTVAAPQGTRFVNSGTANVCLLPGGTLTSVTEGTTELLDGDGPRSVEAGWEVELATGRPPDSRRMRDPILRTSWTHELLALRQPEDGELGRRVDQMLAYLGETKLQHLYEEEIRRLGEHAALPLLRYLAASADGPDAERRRTGARLAADLAGPRDVPDLIELLADNDAEVRSHVARGLQRLTGYDQGRTPEQWLSDSWTACEPAHRAWQQWLQENRDRYPARQPAQSPKRKKA